MDALMFDMQFAPIVYGKWRHGVHGLCETQLLQSPRFNAQSGLKSLLAGANPCVVMAGIQAHTLNVHIQAARYVIVPRVSSSSYVSNSRGSHALTSNTGDVNNRRK